LLLKRSPGGLQTVDAKDRAGIEKLQDVQLERARDLLKGMLIYAQRTDDASKMAAK
jgi:hypothetical protein